MAWTEQKGYDDSTGQNYSVWINQDTGRTSSTNPESAESLQTLEGRLLVYLNLPPRNIPLVAAQLKKVDPTGNLYTADVLQKTWNQQNSQFGNWSGNEDPSDILFKVAKQTPTTADDAATQQFQKSPAGVAAQQQGADLWQQSQDTDSSFGGIMSEMATDVATDPKFWAVIGAGLAATAFAPQAAAQAGITEAGISSGAMSSFTPVQEAVAGWSTEAAGGGTFAGVTEADLAMELAAEATGGGLTMPGAAASAGTTTGGFSTNLGIPAATGMTGAAGTGLGTGVGGGGLGTGLQLPLSLGGTAAGLGLSSMQAGEGFDAGISEINPGLGQLLRPVAEGLTPAGVRAGVTSAVGAPAGSYTGTIPGTVGAPSTDISPQDAFNKILNGVGTAADYAKLGIPLASAIGGAALGAGASKPADYNVTGTTESDTTSNNVSKIDSTSTQATTFSPEETAARAKILSDAERNYAALQGTQYPGQQVTPFSADTLTAFDKLRQFSSGAGQTAADQAAGALKFGLGDVLYPGTNPGLQAMIDTTIRKVGETYTDPNGVLSKIRGGFTAGSSGGSGTREGVANGLAARSYLNTIGDVTGKLTSDAYNQGLNTFSNTLNSVPQTMAAMQVPGKTLAEVGGQVEAKSAEQQAYEANKRMWGITSPTAFLGDFNKILASISNPTRTTTNSGTTTTSGTSHTSGTNNSTISGGAENPFAPLGGALQGLTLGSQLYKILYPNG